VLNGKFHGRRPMGRQRKRWKDIRRDSSMQLNIRGWWRLVGDSNIWGPTIKKSEPDVGCLPEKKNAIKVLCKCHVRAPSL
jgi:hypothetical protein